MAGRRGLRNPLVPFLRRSWPLPSASCWAVTVISLVGCARATLLRSTPTSTVVSLARADAAPVRVSATRAGRRIRVSAG